MLHKKDMTIHLTTAHQLVSDLDQALTFYRDTLGLTLVGDVKNGPFRWITMVCPDQPELKLVLSQPHAGRSQEDGDALARLLAKGALSGPMIFSSKNLEQTFQKLRAARVDVVQEPADQPWGARDCAVRDPSGNLIRISQA